MADRKRLEELKKHLETEGGEDVKINEEENRVEFTDMRGNRAAYEPYGPRDGYRYISTKKLKRLQN